MLLKKAVSILNSAKHFLDFKDDAMASCLGYGLDLGLSCAGGFGGLGSVVSHNFSVQFVGVISHFKGIGYIINVLQQTAC